MWAVERDRVADEDGVFAPRASDAHSADAREAKIKSALAVVGHTHVTAFSECMDRALSVRNLVPTERGGFRGKYSLNELEHRTLLDCVRSYNATQWVVAQSGSITYFFGILWV